VRGRDIRDGGGALGGMKTEVGRSSIRLVVEVLHSMRIEKHPMLGLLGVVLSHVARVQSQYTLVTDESARLGGEFAVYGIVTLSIEFGLLVYGCGST
jgi:hypothetical protein